MKAPKAEKKLEKGKKYLRVTLNKSTIGRLKKHIATVQALGLRKIRQTNVIPDNAMTRGMVKQVAYMITVEEITG